MVDEQRADFVRESMRRSWATRGRAYAEGAALNSATFTGALLEMVPAQRGERVLDVATGPGVVAVAAARLVGPTGRVLATDLVPEWEPLVAEGAAAAGVDNVAFRAMDGGALDFPDGSFDVAYCQFGLMFVPQPVQALREMRRVLRPGGRLGVVVWSTEDKALCFAVLNRHLRGVVPPAPPGQELPTPLSLGEPGLVEGLVSSAGFGDVRVQRRTLDFVYPSAENLWRARVEDGPPNVQQAVSALSPPEKARLKEAVFASLAPYAREGAVRLPSEAVYVAAVA
jgi:SAM-dependent methyltransferase